MYIKLREILYVINAPDVTEEDVNILNNVVPDFLKMYKNLFGHFTCKFHLLIHYYELMLRVGPLRKVSGERFESKHRHIRLMVQSTTSRKIVLKTVGERHQLSLMHLKYAKYETKYIEHGPEIEDTSVYYNFPQATTKKTLKKVTINGITYKHQTIVVVSMDDDSPCFGEIESIYLVDNKYFFKYKSFKAVGFNYHFFAYSLREINVKEIRAGLDIYRTRG